MKATIFPGKCTGSIKIPPSKSMAHRALICASLANGISKITNISYSKDILATIEGMKQIGARIDTYDDYVIVEGIKDFNHLQTSNIFCNESGSTLRFFIPIFSLFNQEITFTGAGRLMSRPQSVYEDLYQKQGLSYYQDDEKIITNGKLKPMTYEVAGNISSQFISGLLFTLPLLDGDSKIVIKEPFESKSYVLLTIQMLALFNVKVELNHNEIVIKGKQKYQACDYAIEGDYSQLGFFAVLAVINNDLTIHGLNLDSLQGDKVIIDILKDFNCSIKEISDGYIINKSTLVPSEIDLKDCPDLGPILNILMMYTKGKSRIFNASRLAYKESNRIKAMENELSKLGVNIKTSENDIIINGQNHYKGGTQVDSHNDHRIVMSLAIAATLLDKEVEIIDAQAINKSYPNFFSDLAKINIKVVLDDE